MPVGEDERGPSRGVYQPKSADSPISPEFDDAAAGAVAEEGSLGRRRRYLTFRYYTYLMASLLVTIGLSALSIALWSEMGCKTYCLECLGRYEEYAGLCGIVVIAVLLALYLFDFFAPMHMPGRYLVLDVGAAFVGRGCLVFAVLACVAWVYLSANSFPTLPLVVTYFFCPLLVVLLRRLTMPVVPERPQSFASVKSLEDRIALIKLLGWEEKDEKNFYIAAMYAFGAAGLASLAAWVPWAFGYEARFGEQIAAAGSRNERELMFARWSAPLFVAASNLVCAGFAGLRVTQHGAYSATDQIKNQLIFDFKNSTQKHMQYRIAWLRARVAAAHNQEEIVRTTRDQLQQYLVRHISATRRLSKIVKSVGLTIVALILALHIVFQMTTVVSHTAIVVQGFLAQYLIVFAIFIFVSFNRVSRKMTLELLDLPFMKNAAAITRSNWFRALALCLALPFVPIVLFMSSMNQALRKRRGIARSESLLTERVSVAFEHMAKWNWPDVLRWCYIMAGVLMVFRMSPIFLNVLLAWMSWVMADLNFWLICASTFAMGVFLFMLPPVPGPIIYPFAGVVMSDPRKCPFGFWGGCAVSVVVSFFMKMTACTLQQKGIGELLGSKVAIRRAVGIHTPPIRAIESVLKKPGLSFGKCMILCGGPDWPTSVLAGILRLSLWQCLLGTCPVLFSIVPMALTGSFYLKRSESEVWLRTGNLMLFVTTVVSAVFLVGIGWAIQDEYDKRGSEISKPKEEFVELAWLDHRAARANERCKVEWRDIPSFVQVIYIAGATMATLVGHLLLWFTSSCFGAFQITDDIQSLRWIGSATALIKPLGMAGLIAGAGSYAGLIIFGKWRTRRIAGPLKEVYAELEEQEAGWKHAWLQEARLASMPSKQPRRSLSSAAPTLLSRRSSASVKSVDTARTLRSVTAPPGSLCDVAGMPDGVEEGMQASVSKRGRALAFALEAMRHVQQVARRPRPAAAPGGGASALAPGGSAAGAAAAVAEVAVDEQGAGALVISIETAPGEREGDSDGGASEGNAGSVSPSSITVSL